ncbi:hypothetical protein BGZ76_009688 [Entomortierella beljakovae]|nr:hypothetical protein BGZ76_009688 [Entomortierella beljakovae]
MEYEDDDYDQYQQYEDEIYRDASEESQSGSDVDSELEDNMLAHIHYSTNVYKKVNNNAAKPVEPTVIQAPIDEKSGTNSLAAPPTPAEDYFKSVNEGNELDSEGEESIIKASSYSKTSDASTKNENKEGIQLKNGDINDPDDDSRYNVEKKIHTRKSKWNQSTSVDGEDEDSSDDDSKVVTRQDHNTTTDVLSEETELNQHVIDFGATEDNSDEDKYDVEAKLGHLEDEDFKGRTRYYLEKRERDFLCFKCGKPGHIGRECTVMLCYVCGAVDSHYTRNCPVSQCFNCKQTGHILETCPFPRGSYQNCQTCYSKDHITDDCPTIWREYVLTSKEPLQRKLHLYCYNCAEKGHFGDECDRSRPFYSKSSGSAFSSRPCARYIYPGSKSIVSTLVLPPIHNSSTTSHQNSSSRNAQNSSSRRQSPSRNYSSSRRRSSHSRSPPPKRDNSKVDRAGSRDYRDHYDDYATRSGSKPSKSVQKRQRTYRDRDQADQLESRSGQDHDRNDNERLNSYAEHNDKKDDSIPKQEFKVRSRRDRVRLSRQQLAMTPTTATGSSVDNILGSAAQQKSGTSTNNPIVIKDTSDTPSTRSNSGNKGKLHHSLPDIPKFQSRRAANGSSNKQSFAERNAFPRGGDDGTHPGDGMIGLPTRPSGPMYTGGYSKRQ